MEKINFSEEELNNFRGSELNHDAMHASADVNPALGQNNEMAQLDATVAQAVSQRSYAQANNSFINVHQMGTYIDEGLKMKAPQELIPHILVEHETGIFFGDTGVGKSIMAMQMAMQVAATGRNVLYVNFELSQLQLSKRYPEKKMPSTLFIASIDYTKMHDVTDQSLILAEIEKIALQYQAEVIFIDNLINLCLNSKDGNEAGNIMLRLITLRMTHDFTMLVLAHVPKRKASDPLTLNDVAGSKLLSNLADNVVGINKSKLGSNKRYIIQLKCRSGSIVLDSNNVQELSLTMEGGYLHFEYGGFDEERVHLPRSRDEKAELERDIVKELKQPNGLSYRNIADKLGTSLPTVQRVAKSHNLSRGGAKDKGNKCDDL